MRFNKLDLNLLVALDAMLAERSVSRAAERLHVSQSTMSSSLTRLRTYFEDELLVQVGRKLELTPRAETLKEAVRDVLSRVDTAIATQPQFDPTQSDREFRMFVSDYTLVTLMPHLLALARRQSSTVRFQLSPLPQMDRPQRALERGDADLLVIPRNYCSREHPAEVLFEEEFNCVVWSGSRFAHAGELTLDQYVAAGHVVTQPTGTDQPTLESWFMQRHGIVRRVEVTTYSFVAAPFVVIGTECIATVHGRLARLAQRSQPLKLHALPVPMPRMEQAMQWHKYRTHDPGLVWLRGLLHEAAWLMDAEQTAGARPTASRFP
ncbi:transcriptional regulator, LysR family [Variovorax sp. CF079]|uniref:LysR family transcriptional regulator n=1 Tax=Variovorax sp. CF079 TaxID=1882774 RepID=UPI00088CAD1D|nr:LysR family transcriptional regulator [Variovorax sp. CF079]SDE21871.1 transcriptional regulator, LysR family [Variovorax sp. CF079]